VPQAGDPSGLWRGLLPSLIIAEGDPVQGLKRCDGGTIVVLFYPNGLALDVQADPGGMEGHVSQAGAFGWRLVGIHTPH
jgi:hypothetical protein